MSDNSSLTVCVMCDDPIAFFGASGCANVNGPLFARICEAVRPSLTRRGVRPSTLMSFLGRARARPAKFSNT